MAVGRSKDRSPYHRFSIPTQRISDFPPSKAGANLVNSFTYRLLLFDVSNGNRCMKDWNLVSLEFQLFRAAMLISISLYLFPSGVPKIQVWTTCELPAL
ncbi:hypothetical protein AVEN_233921-1 [Araneus ventricosus]|uniref:Uncharacterized protein n=1 Tax=Araneus ventricosus TaxID=182803 RepID=A0A4Y2LN15_ARAVE|nr:hypothetical protein AVEN_233921-1 [Araneus ventricosus]